MLRCVEVGAWSAQVLVPPEPPVDACDNLKGTEKHDQADEKKSRRRRGKDVEMVHAHINRSSPVHITWRRVGVPGANTGSVSEYTIKRTRLLVGILTN